MSSRSFRRRNNRRRRRPAGNGEGSEPRSPETPDQRGPGAQEDVPPRSGSLQGSPENRAGREGGQRRGTPRRGGQKRAGQGQDGQRQDGQRQDGQRQDGQRQDAGPRQEGGQRREGRPGGRGAPGRGSDEAAPQRPAVPLVVPDCPVCGKPVRELPSALTHRASRQPAHFDCVVRELRESNELSPQEKLCYLGGGCFGVLEFKAGGGATRFVIKRRIQYEEKETPQDWKKQLQVSC